MTTTVTAGTRPPSVLAEFAAQVVRARRVWTVSGEDGLARIASTVIHGREATLVWSNEADAGRWAPSMARHARINPILLENFTQQVLPRLADMQRLVAPEYGANGPNLEIEAADLTRALERATREAFVSVTRALGRMFILEDDIGPAFVTSVTGGNRLVLACWTDRDAAEMQCTGFWSEMVVSEIPLDALVQRTLPWIAGIDRGVTLNPGQGGCRVEIDAASLLAELQSDSPRNLAAA